MPDFQLFRLKIYKPRQINIYEKDKTRSEILREVILSLPSAELRKGARWLIGNIAFLDEFGLYFRIGRISKATVGTYENGNFLDQESEIVPSTHVVLDTSLEVCAIASKAKLAPRTIGIAYQFARLLSRSQVAQLYSIDFEIDEINDPEDFVTYLRSAFLISRFWVTFSRPNPFDSHYDFIRPFERMLEESNGDTGKVEIQGGKGLDPASLEAMTRSAAATGNDAGAWILQEKGEKKTRKRLSGNPVIFSEEDLTDRQKQYGLLQRVRELYHRIRRNDGVQGD